MTRKKTEKRKAKGLRAATRHAGGRKSSKPNVLKDTWTKESDFMGKPSFEPRTLKGLQELTSSLNSLYGRHHILNVLARNENFERLRKISGLFTTQMYMSDGIDRSLPHNPSRAEINPSSNNVKDTGLNSAKGIGCFADVVRNGYI